jgi:hypothetical protein
MTTTWTDALDERQQKELDFARLYATHYAHGTDGHSRLMLIARLAELLDAQAAATPALAGLPSPGLDRLVETARQLGAGGIWLVRGAEEAILLYSHDASADRPEPGLTMQPPHDLIVLLRFPTGDGGESGVEFRT